MAFTTGSVDTFANKDIVGEVLGTGDGSTTVFNLQTAKKPIFLTPFTLKYTVSSTQHSATTDSSGNLTGTHISSGTVAETGAISVTFSTPPDNTTNITGDSRTKGLLQKVLDYIAPNNATETLGTGNGSTTVFSGTLSNTNIAKGQMQVKFVIATQTFYAYDDGNGSFDHEKITAGSSSINYTTGAWQITFTTAPDNTTNIDTLYAHTSGEGQDWLVVTSRKSRDSTGSDAFPSLEHKEVVLKNSGGSFKDHVWIGIRETQYPADNFYRWNLNVYFNYINGDDFQVNGAGGGGHGKTGYDNTYENWTQLPGLPPNDDTMNYFIYSNKNRVIVVIRVAGTNYDLCYLGFALRFATATLYPHPYIAAGTIQDNENHTQTNDKHMMGVLAPRQFSGLAHQCLMVKPDKAWLSPDGYDTIPIQTQNLPANTFAKNTNNNVVVFPIYANEAGNNQKLFFQYEGVFYLPNEEVQSEDIVTVSAQNYKVFQNIHRITPFDYLCVKEV